MALSTDELAAAKTRLSEARTALHQLMIGQSVVRVQDQNGENVTYSSANISRLRSYIKELEALIATGGPGNSGPFRPVFL